MKWKKIGSAFYEVAEKEDAIKSLQMARNEMYNIFFRGRHLEIVKNLLERKEVNFEELGISPNKFQLLEERIVLLVKKYISIKGAPHRLEFREFCPL
ncbi:hypothetical protein KKG29_01090 [Patescibacteria group bacterium]|nr:hypothetical protein [Patescibacteria group bacterium]MBU4082844.1 hypothetical protein [Patescibacteria group bacterium]